ncbi:MAG: PPK2 family polyphosphate kinase [Candidatus Eisenbacteria bacterium]
MNWCDRSWVPAKGRLRLGDIDPNSTPGAQTKAARARLEKNLSRIDELQYLMYARRTGARSPGLSQAMDAGGKDGAIRTLTRGMNPQGCVVTSAPQPSAEELEHDFLWRITPALPRRGEIGIFNRSHYEDVLIVRVHQLVPKSVWAKRYEQINRFEENLAENGIHLVKFFLHISKEEQAERFRERAGRPQEELVLSPADLAERSHWGRVSGGLSRTRSEVQSEAGSCTRCRRDKKWYRDLAISDRVETMSSFDMRYPSPTSTRRTSGSTEFAPVEFGDCFRNNFWTTGGRAPDSSA